MVKNADKMPQTEGVGRVALVQAGKPLLYARYSSVEELLKASSPNKVEVSKPDDERPSKKQKRTGAPAAPVAAAAADAPAGSVPTEVAADKGFGAVGEDGLTYKQRRQLRRAGERTAKLDADAAAAAAAADQVASTGVEGSEGPADGVAGTNACGTDDRHKAEAVAGQMAEAAAGGSTADVATTVPTATPAPAAGMAAPSISAGNADEAARMRNVLGFAGNGGAPGGNLSLANLATASMAQVAPAATGPPTSAGAAGPVPMVEGAVEVAGHTGKRKSDKEDSKEQKKKKKADRKALEQVQREEKAAAEASAAAVGEVAEPVPAAAAPAAEAEAKTAEAKAARTRATGGMQFSFDFKVQPAVEAEVEARLARIMAVDSTRDGFVPRRVWVSGLPHEYDEEMIREYWGYCGEVEAMHLLTFPDSGNFNGTAFVTFKTQEAYTAALACSGEMLEGRALRVEKCKASAEFKGKARASAAAAAGAGAAATAPTSPAPGDKGAGAGGKVAGYPVAYCGNVSFEADAEDLKQLFVAAGAAPTKVRLHTDKASGRSKGFAHVHFANDEDVARAVALDGTPLHGRKIKVSYAQPKPGDAQA